MQKTKSIALILGVLTISFGIIYLATAFTEPTQAPPGGNVSAPLNVGSSGQAKAGGLILNTGGAATGLIVDKGNVGIGEVSPSAQLHISNTAYSPGVTPSIKFSNAHGEPLLIDAYPNNTPGAYAGFGLGGSVRLIMTPVGGYNAILGTTNPSSLEFITNATPRISVTSAGNVGIGTTNPTQKLDVIGYVRGSTGLCIAGDCRTSWPAGITSESDTLTSVIDRGSLTLSIPTFQAGGVLNQVAVGSDPFGSLSNPYESIQLPSWANLRFAFGSQATVIMTNTGNVGIGTTNPTQKLDVNGNVAATGFFYSASDRTLKENIEGLSGAVSLDKILNLQGVSFDWKKDGSHSVGLIAQDVENIYPELVSTDPSTGLKSVAYSNLIAPLIEAVKAQQKEIEALKAEVEALKAAR